MARGRSRHHRCGTRRHLQAVGRYDPALTIYIEAVKRRADFASLGALAPLHADRGEIAAAEQMFEESRHRYRGVSPFPLALLDFQRGHMWMTHGDIHRARAWFVEACRLLPCYAPANGHLAEVEAALGETDIAINRLRQLAEYSDDPDYAAALARILANVGQRRRRQRAVPQQRLAMRNSCQLTARRSQITRRPSGSRRGEIQFKRYRSRKAILKFGEPRAPSSSMHGPCAPASKSAFRRQ